MYLDQILILEFFHQPPGLTFVGLGRMLPPDSVDNLFERLEPRWNPLHQPHNLDPSRDDQWIREISIIERFEGLHELRSAIIRWDRPEFLKLGARENCLGFEVGSAAHPVDHTASTARKLRRVRSVINEKYLFEVHFGRYSKFLLVELVL